VSVLDQKNKRVSTYRRGIQQKRVDLPLSGAPADLAVGEDGALYVLEHRTGVVGGALTTRVFDSDGRSGPEVMAVEARADMIRIGPSGPEVHHYPSDLWMPLLTTEANGATPAKKFLPREQQLNLSHPGLSIANSGTSLTRNLSSPQVVLKATSEEVRAALVDGGGVRQAWRVLNHIPGARFGEVQVADLVGDDLLLVVRVWTENQEPSEKHTKSSRADFRVLRISGSSVVSDFAVSTYDWALMSPVSRFRLTKSGLYQMQTDPDGLRVVRFNIGG
jgi:hypothetical protein